MEGPADVSMTGEESASLITILMMANFAAVNLKRVALKQGDEEGTVNAMDYLREQISMAISVIAERQNGEHDTMLQLPDESDEPAAPATDEELIEYGFYDDVHGSTLH